MRDVKSLGVEANLPAWIARFPERSHIWLGDIRVWRVESLGESRTTPSTELEEWLVRAITSGAQTPTDAAERLGLPISVVQSVWSRVATPQPLRSSAAYLELPKALWPVQISSTLPAWPLEDPSEIPAALRTYQERGDWRTVPTIRAERMNVFAVAVSDGIDVYEILDGGQLADSPIARVPTGSLQLAALALQE